MSIYSSSVKNPITTIMIFLAVIVFGLYSLSSLPIDLYPEMEPPYISIMTTYPGASAADIETNVTKPIEDALNSVDNLKNISSRSIDNMSVVFAEFEWESNLDEAVNDIRNSLSFVEEALPDDCKKPTIFKFNSSMMPILFYAVTAKESYPALNKILEEKLINPLNRIEGIGSIGLEGTPKREIAIEVNPQKLEAYNLTVEDIGNVLKAENINMPLGKLEMGAMDYSLRVEGEFKESSVIQNIVIGSYMGKSIYLKDVAYVRDTIKKRTIDQKINGENGIRLFVMKQSGANTVKITKQVNAEIEKLKKTLPPDIQLIQIFDSSVFINHSISNLTETLMWAFLFVVLVVIFFLGRWRATFIIVLTIPISLIVAFIYLKLSGNSINIISLSALSIAIGMVVDDAIVVLENISKHIDRGASPREAAIYATNEVWLAVIVTTLTVVAVFLPLTMVTGMTGVLFKQLGWIVTITVVTSTIAAISLTPMLSSKMLRLKPKKLTERKWSYDNIVIRFLDTLDAFYEKSIRWALAHKKTVVFSSIGIFVASIFLVSQVGSEFIPETDQSTLNITVELQTGTRVEKTVEVTRKITEIIETKYPEVKVRFSSSGSDSEGDFTSLFSESGSHMINFRMLLTQPSERNRTVWEIADALRKDLDGIAEIEKYSVSTQDGMSFGGGNAISVEIYGYDFAKTDALARQIADSIKSLPGARDVKISRKKEKPELKVVLDQEKMALNGLNNAMVSMALRNRIQGYTSTKYREKGDEYDVVVRFAEEDRNTITEIENISIKNMYGKMIRLKEIGKVEEHWAAPNIEHKRRERIVTVSASPHNVSLGDLSKRIQKQLDSIEKPSEILVNMGGSFEDMQESFADLGLLMILVLLLVYIVMAAQFESLKMPLIIMFSIPFAFSGVFIALFISGKTFSVIAALGAIMLIGIVVKNAIVLIDYINLMRERGYELNEAISLSGRSRLRPVLMTAATTVLGMVPMALSKGEGSEIWSPMGIAVIGGLIFSTIITLIIVPVGYNLMARKGEMNKKKQLEKQFHFLDN